MATPLPISGVLLRLLYPSPATSRAGRRLPCAVDLIAAALLSTGRSARPWERLPSRRVCQQIVGGFFSCADLQQMQLDAPRRPPAVVPGIPSDWPRSLPENFRAAPLPRIPRNGDIDHPEAISTAAVSAAVSAAAQRPHVRRTTRHGDADRRQPSLREPKR